MLFSFELTLNSSSTAEKFYDIPHQTAANVLEKVTIDQSIKFLRLINLQVCNRFFFILKIIHYFGA